MSNPNPKLRNDYRDYIKNPKLRTRDVLIWIDKQGGVDITSRKIAAKFNLEVAEGASRLEGLRKWGCMHIIHRGRGNQPFIWEITAWGKKMAKKWLSERAHSNVQDAIKK